MNTDVIRAAFLNELGKIAADVPSRGDMRDKKSHDVQDAGKSIKGHSYGNAPEDDYHKMAAGELDKKPGDVPAADEPVKSKGTERAAGRTLGSSAGGQGTAPPDDKEYVNAVRFYGAHVSLSNISPTIHQDSQHAPSSSSPLDKMAKASLVTRAVRGAKRYGELMRGGRTERTREKALKELRKLRKEAPPGTTPKELVATPKGKRLQRFAGLMKAEERAVLRTRVGTGVGLTAAGVAAHKISKKAADQLDKAASVQFELWLNTLDPTVKEVVQWTGT